MPSGDMQPGSDRTRSDGWPTVARPADPYSGGVSERARNNSKPASESRLGLVRRARRMLRALAEAYPDAHCELDFDTPLQLAVATILSAQCTDKRVNEVTPALFAR